MTSFVTRIALGAVAGAIGTVAMDLVWYGRYRRGGGEDGPLTWEFAGSVASFEEASAPGQVGKRLADTVGVTLPDSAAATTTNAMHWLTGAGYGVAHALLLDGRPPLPAGVATGAGAVANSYATLGAMGIYEPIWRYDAATIAKDVTAHLVFGVATSLAYRALAGGRDRTV
ncbi:MAG: hypothetical protein ACNA8R_05260 [Nitriliruptoraceae bacterium]